MEKSVQKIILNKISEVKKRYIKYFNLIKKYVIIYIIIVLLINIFCIPIVKGIGQNWENEIIKVIRDCLELIGQSMIGLISLSVALILKLSWFLVGVSTLWLIIQLIIKNQYQMDKEYIPCFAISTSKEIIADVEEALSLNLRRKDYFKSDFMFSCNNNKKETVVSMYLGSALKEEIDKKDYREVNVLDFEIVNIGGFASKIKIDKVQIGKNIFQNSYETQLEIIKGKGQHIKYKMVEIVSNPKVEEKKIKSVLIDEDNKLKFSTIRINYIITNIFGDEFSQHVEIMHGNTEQMLYKISRVEIMDSNGVDNIEYI